MNFLNKYTDLSNECFDASEKKELMRVMIDVEKVSVKQFCINHKIASVRTIYRYQSI